MMLRAWNMSPNDVQTMQVGSSPAMMAALEKGGIDAAVLTEPTFFFAEDQGYRVLADLADTDIYYLHSMIDTTRAFVRTHRDLALRLCAAISKASLTSRRTAKKVSTYWPRSYAPRRHKQNIWSVLTRFTVRA